MPHNPSVEERGVFARQGFRRSTSVNAFDVRDQRAQPSQLEIEKRIPFVVSSPEMNYSPILHQFSKSVVQRRRALLGTRAKLCHADCCALVDEFLDLGGRQVAVPV